MSDMSYEAFREKWTAAPEPVKAWMRHKATWEHISLWAVAIEHGFPTEAEARERVGA